jgi:hypothetical protein
LFWSIKNSLKLTFWFSCEKYQKAGKHKFQSVAAFSMLTSGNIGWDDRRTNLFVIWLSQNLNENKNHRISVECCIRAHFSWNSLYTFPVLYFTNSIPDKSTLLKHVTWSLKGYASKTSAKLMVNRGLYQKGMCVMVSSTMSQIQ